MAKITIGLGMSHSTQMSLAPDKWNLLADYDLKSGRVPDFLERENRLGNTHAKEITLDVWKRRYDACQVAVKELNQKLYEISPDVLIIIGNDQKELFLEDTNPAFTIPYGDYVYNIPPDKNKLTPSQLASFSGYHADEKEAYPVQTDLALHMIEELMAQENFDLATFKEQPEGRTLGHSYTIVRRRVMTERFIPIVPVMINTYYKPNQPTPKRCYEFGKAIRRAIDSWDSDKTVGVIVTGGLSHFIIDEELDRGVIRALENKDESYLTSLRRERLQSGDSEILSWIATAAVFEDRDFRLIDYIPTYRSLAGTGCGMTYSTWE
jgi:hypothetical protein